MPRPSKTGAPARPPRKRQLTELFLRKVKPEAAPFVWDARQHGLVLSVQPTGHRSLRVRPAGRSRWYHVGAAGAVGLGDARRIAASVTLAAAEGHDPAAERKAERATGPFHDLAAKYVELYAKKRKKSWRQAEALVNRYLSPKWKGLEASFISRADVKALNRIEAPILQNQVVASASAILVGASSKTFCRKAMPTPVATLIQARSLNRAREQQQCINATF
jgi:hypothetical protein